MTINITMPALSPTMEEGTLAKWLKKEGDKIESGDVIAEIETDKATMEVEAVDEGTLGKIMVAAGTEGVKVNAVIAVLLEEGEDKKNIVIPSEAEGSKPSKKEDPSTSREQSSRAAQDDKDNSNSPPVSAKAEPSPPQAGGIKGGSDKDRLFASPLAKRIAADKGIDLTSVQGSGPHGRIVKADIENAKGGGMAKAASPQLAPPEEGWEVNEYGMQYQPVKNSGMRKVIAKRLVESKQNVPHFYLTIECRIDNLLQARKEMNEAADGAYKLSVNDFVIKAAAQALKTYPAANVQWTDDAILQFKHADISVAVATDQGLITPIIKAAETKGLREISSEVKDLAKKARDGKLKPEEFQGGSFSISNLGMFGIKEFGAIINPPQSCILAVGAGEQEPYVHKGEVKIGTFMSCTLSVDHRSVDGAVGAEYLQVLKQYLENPVSMLV